MIHKCGKTNRLQRRQQFVNRNRILSRKIDRRNLHHVTTTGSWFAPLLEGIVVWIEIACWWGCAQRRQRESFITVGGSQSVVAPDGFTKWFHFVCQARADDFFHYNLGSEMESSRLKRSLTHG